MKIAAAQIQVQLGNIEGNLETHLKMIRLAAAHDADLIIFPELSLTTYCREEARALSLTTSDQEIAILKEKAAQHELIIVVGAPVEIDEKLYIASFLIHPHQATQIYTKQYLHEGEELYYASSFKHNPIISLNETRAALAICADINHPQHPQNAKDKHCNLYLASIFFSEKGIDEGRQRLASYAKEHSFAVLMSNYSGKTWQMQAGGKTSFWDEKGQRIASLDKTSQGVLLVEKRDQNWHHQVLIPKENTFQ